MFTVILIVIEVAEQFVICLYLSIRIDLEIAIRFTVKLIVVEMNRNRNSTEAFVI